MEGHYDLTNAKDEMRLPGLWDNTIKPGDSISMKMWPGTQALLRHYGPPPYAGSLREDSDYQASQGRLARLRRVPFNNGPGRIPPHLRGPGHHAGQFNPFTAMLGRPGFPGPGGPGPMTMPMAVGLSRPPQCRPMSVASSTVASSVDEDKLTDAEKKELTFVNFVEELRKTKDASAADLLAKFTELRDISGCLDSDRELWGSDVGSGVDSDSTGTSSTGSRSIIDD